LKRFLYLLALGIVGAFFVRHYCYEGVYIASESMEPTLPKNRHVMVNKFSRWYREPARGDVIMFDAPSNSQKGMIKRVIAVGGETIEIRDKKVYINGRRLDEPYVQFLNPDTLFIGDNIPPLTIPENHLFVMGDNRDVSGDSRDWKSPRGRHTPFLAVSKVKGYVQ
jgi:signal peptidase I